MPTETNVYSRNLKVISLFFIIYWLLGLHPQDNVLSLGTVRFNIDDPRWLPYIANGLLLYFAWRFFIHSRKKVSSSYTSFLRYEMLNRKHKFWCKKLTESAEKDFANNGKFEDFQKLNANDFFDKLKPEQCRISLPSLSNSNTPIKFGYRYIASVPSNLEGRPSNVKTGSYIFKFNYLLRTTLNLHMITLWLLFNEDSADYLIPWVLFFIAVFSIFIRCDEYSISTTLVAQCKNC
ncbi:hypothetical protein KCG43_19210 [Photobacterium sp. WH24]|uniref:hypothetical protein n=1 Tax=Photobacterium sp. WH24 TaxID=2827237 RepID=UPI001C43FE9F|nr:hypothetical protein [Photobacterium sp. WH24]MBV7264145.1 hypothetical protein [Photobacterium sp. WH24]